MTQADDASTMFGSRISSGRMNGHAVASVTESRNIEESSPSSISPPEQPEASSEPVLAMGSTDSASNAHGSGSSCGLVSSLFPSSCRGRAEAFARRLHHRLTSLGSESNGQEDAELTKPSESSWLHSNAGARTTPPTISSHSYNDQQQSLQQQLSQSPDSDLYYDLSLDLDEEDGPSSPAEEATPAELTRLLVNADLSKKQDLNCPETKQLSGSNQDAFSSPVMGNTSESDDSDVFFDPISSDSERKNDVFYDPVTTSDSESSSRVPNGVNGFPYYCKNNNNNYYYHDKSDGKEESSESVCMSRRDTVPRHFTDNSSTTSPSHDSLWSTFDDSTVSLKDDSPSRPDFSYDGMKNGLPKSFSDSVLPIKDADDVLEHAGVKENGTVDEVDFVVAKSPSCTNGLNGRKDATDEDENKSLPNTTAEETAAASDTDTDHSTYSSSLNIPGALTLECPLSLNSEEVMKNEVQLQIEEGGSCMINGEDKMSLLLEKLGHKYTDKTEEVMRSKHSTDTDEEDVKTEEEKEEVSEEAGREEEEEEQRPPRVRRCSSLKTGKTPPGTPGRKKIVRFADVLGLDLADVRTFLDEIPKIPNSAYSDLIYDDVFQKDSSPVNCGMQSWNVRYMDHRSPGHSVSQKSDKTLVPLFQQPGGLVSFLDKVREQLVCLENAVVADTVNLSIRGTVRVLNLDFHKSVHIRYTLNSWQNYSDLQATYVPNSCDGFSDKFTFQIYCHTLRVGQKLEFAVRFHCKGMQYWDNNSGANYCFQCLPARSSLSYIPITATENTQDWGAPMFY